MSMHKKERDYVLNNHAHMVANTHTLPSRPVVYLKWLRTNLMKPKSMAVLLYCSTFPFVVLDRGEK